MFVLFWREGGVLRPHFPAIEAMVANLQRVVEMGGEETQEAKSGKLTAENPESVKRAGEGARRKAEGGNR
jgi:hypothetical protein